MTRHPRFSLGLIGLSLLLASQAAAALEPGQRLTNAQTAQWSDMTQHDIGGTRLRVVPVPAPDQGTWLLNTQNVVGLSRNEVTVTDAPVEQARAILQHATPQPVSMQHYAPTQIIVVRYANFNDAMLGRQALQAALPQATVRLPVQFGRPTPR